MSKVGAKSSINLLRIKRCSKEMEEAGESHLVYRELNIFCLLNRPLLFNGVYETLLKCKEHGNLLPRFKDGVFKFFVQGYNTTLRLAGEMGKRHAIFMNVMLMLAKDRENKANALRMLNFTFRGSGRSDEVRGILSRIRGLYHGRELKFHGIVRSCSAHVGVNYKRVGAEQWQWYLDCNVCFGNIVLLNLLPYLVWIIDNPRIVMTKYIV